MSEEMKLKFCSNCGNKVSEEYIYCKKCGNHLRTRIKETTRNENNENNNTIEEKKLEYSKRQPGEIISKIAFWLVAANIIIWIIGQILQTSLPAPYFMLAGLICGIVGIVKSKKSGKINRLAIIATIVALTIFSVAFASGLYNLVQY